MAALAMPQRAYDLSRDPNAAARVARLEYEVGNAARATHAFESFLAQCAARARAPQFAAARQLQTAAASTARLPCKPTCLRRLGSSSSPARCRGANASSVSAVLDAGERRISFSKPGYETRTLQLKLDPGEPAPAASTSTKADGGRSENRFRKPRWSRNWRRERRASTVGEPKNLRGEIRGRTRTPRAACACA